MARLGCYNQAGSAITNGKEPKSCLGRVFNFKLGSFTDNAKIVEHANYSKKSVWQGFSNDLFSFKFDSSYLQVL